MVSMEAVPDAQQPPGFQQRLPRVGLSTARKGPTTAKTASVAPFPAQTTRATSGAATRRRRPSTTVPRDEGSSEEDIEDYSGSYQDSQPSAPLRHHDLATRNRARSMVASASPAPSVSAMPPPPLPTNKRRRQVFESPSQPATTKRRRVSESQQSQRTRSRVEEERTALHAVFAIYFGDKSYYAADVVGSLGGGKKKYMIEYADGSCEQVQLASIRPGPASLQPGDALMVKTGKWAAASFVRAEPAGCWVSLNGNGAEEKVDWASVKRTKAQVGAGTMTADEVDALVVEREEGESQAQTQTQTQSVPQSIPPPLPPVADPWEGPDTEDRGMLEVQAHDDSLLLTDFAFVLTRAPNTKGMDSDWREALPAELTSAAGTVLDDWTDVLSFHNGGGLNGSRWHAHAEDMRLLSGADKRVVLLADAPTMTPKYLFALALGVPCLSAQWAIDVLDGVSLLFLVLDGPF